MRRVLVILLSLILPVACGPRQARKPAPEPAPLSRAFPTAEVPIMYSQPQERIGWLVQHFWEPFTDTGTLFPCDSNLVNGVARKDVESQMGIFATLLQNVPPPEAQKGVKRLFDRAQSFQSVHPESNLFPELVSLTAHYLYDPNSPVRSEESYLPFVQALSQSELVPEPERARYAWQAQICALNRPGTPAANFSFVDTEGRRRSLYGIKAPLTLLIFGNPDCKACREIMEMLSTVPAAAQLIASGSLKVVDVYIDEDIAAWKAGKDSYPREWINGYDPSFTIRQDLLYCVRAIPSLYLLDRDKRVLLKDATPEAVLEALQSYV